MPYDFMRQKRTSEPQKHNTLSCLFETDLTATAVPQHLKEGRLNQLIWRTGGLRVLDAVDIKGENATGSGLL